MKINIFSSALLLFSLQQATYAQDGPSKLSKRIAGGFAVPANMALHAVRLSFAGDTTGRICSGSLISDSHIVTAAHCVVDNNSVERKPGDITIGYGNVDVNQQSKAKAVKVHLHPDFLQNGEKSLSNSIAIIEIEPLTLSASVNRIPIYNKAIEPKQVMFTTGWGITAGDAENSSILQGVAVVAGDKDTCARGNAEFESNAGPLICIPNALTPGRSSCSNDGGGSVLVSSGKFTMLAGFNNFAVYKTSSNACGGDDDDILRFSTNVSYFMDFIVSATGKQKEYFTSTDGIDANGGTLPTKSSGSPDDSAPTVDPNKTTTVTSVTVVTSYV